MVAKLSFNAFLTETLNYNEKKVQQGKAELIHAVNFLIDKDRMTFHQKFERLEHYNTLRPDVNVNTLHAKISFPANEQLSDDTLQQIADRYMKGIGFENQPYLVYKHEDTAQPHMHIVSTIIRDNGDRIATHYMGRDLSEPTRKSIEKDFGLEKAEDHRLKEAYRIRPVDVQKIVYGERGTKESIQQVVKMVMDEYKFGSLHEFNALLREYNVFADRGKQESETYKRNGLNYKVLDENGKVVGTPIKASSFYFKPTLKNLETKFAESKAERKKDIADIRSRIDYALLQKPASLQEFTKSLEQDDIHILARQNDKGQIYGLTFIDHQSKTVINGGDIGKGYSAGPILAKFGMPRHSQIQNTQQQSSTLSSQDASMRTSQTQQHGQSERQQQTQTSTQTNRQTQYQQRSQQQGQSPDSTRQTQSGQSTQRQNTRQNRQSQQAQSQTSKPSDTRQKPGRGSDGETSQQSKQRRKMGDGEGDDVSVFIKPTYNLNVPQPLSRLTGGDDDTGSMPLELKKDKRKTKKKKQ